MNDEHHTKRERHSEEHNIIQQLNQKRVLQWQTDGLNTLTYDVVENSSDTFGIIG